MSTDTLIEKVREPILRLQKKRAEERVLRKGRKDQFVVLTIDTNGKYTSEDPKKMDERLQRAVQVLLRNQIESKSLRDSLVCARELTIDLKQDLDGAEAIASLGIEITDVALTSIKPSPETGKALEAEIRDVIRSNTSPRHVPAKIVAVPDIPRTRSGKIVELAVRSVVHGEDVRNTEALANPEALAYFKDIPNLKD